MKVKCESCGKKFHKKGIHGHMRTHQKEKEIISENRSMMAAQPSDFERGRSVGYREGLRDPSSERKKTMIQALEAAAKAVDAIAHMVGDFRAS